MGTLSELGGVTWTPGCDLGILSNATRGRLDGTTVRLPAPILDPTQRDG